MQQYSDTIQDRQGNVIGAATVTVTNYPSGTTATTYATNAIGSNTNPITADNNGQYSFYATDGSYTVTTSKSGITTSSKVITLSDQQVFVSVKGYGATGGGTVDDTPAIQSAVSTGNAVYVPDGTYLLTDAITCATKGQIIQGAGRQRTIFLVKNTFNLSALGVFKATSGEEGPQFKDIQIQFTQPDTAVRGNLVAYPPALYMQSTPRFTVSNVSITNAMTGIDMKGNSGGAFIDQLELSAYNVGIDIDGSLDSVRISRLQFYTFGLTANQQTIFNDSTTIGLKCARADDLHISDSLFIGGTGKAIRFYTSGSGSAFGNIVNTDFDSYGGLNVESGKISVSSCYFSMGNVANQAIIQTGGDVRVTACKFESTAALTNAMVSCTGTAGAYLSVGNSMFANTGDMKCVYVAAASGNNTAIVTGCQFIAPANTSPANALCHAASGGRLTFTANRASDKGTGSGNLVQLDADDHHNVIGNDFVGWSLSSISPQILAIINNNNSVDGWVSYTPTITSGSGSFTTVSATGLYKQYGKTIHIQIAVTITTNGTAAGQVNATTPRNANSTTGGFTFAGRAAAVSGKALQCYLPTGTGSIAIVNYDNTYPGANGELLIISGTYQSA